MPTKNKTSQTNAAFVTKQFRLAGYEPLSSGQARHRFRDGIRVHRPEETGAPVTATILNRRLGLDIAKVLADVDEAFANSGVTVIAEAAPDGKTATMTFRRLPRYCKTADGYNVEHVIRDKWLVRVSRFSLWLVEFPAGTDPSTVDFFLADGGTDYKVLGTAERWMKNSSRPDGWYVDASQEGTKNSYKHSSASFRPLATAREAREALLALAAPPTQEDPQ